jgi:alpha-galactosidase
MLDVLRAGLGPFRAEKALGCCLSALLLAVTPIGCRSSNSQPVSGAGAFVDATVAGTGGTSNAMSSGAGGVLASGGTSAPTGPIGGSGGMSAGGKGGRGGGAGAVSNGGSGGPGDAGPGGSDGGEAAPSDAGDDAGMSAILGATPPMGWNSWNTFQCNMDEMVIKQMADAIVSSGMQGAGYEYVNLDDCWMDGRDPNGKLRWNTSKFPSGIPALAEYVHGKGLKLGIYEVPNDTTCVGLYGGISHSVAVGSLGHETIDAQTFASWGVDYLKYDLCAGQRNGFAVMRDALSATGRPIFLSINPGNGQGDLCPPNRCSLDLPTIANMWRIGFDIGPNWDSVIRLIDANAGLSSFAGPGHWNDPDMLEVGHGLTDTEGQAHFSMWAMMAAPLIAGNDLRNMSAATRTTLTNAEVIAVDQDPLGIQGRLVALPSLNLAVWSKPLSGKNTRAVALFNRGAASASITVAWSALELPPGAAKVRDLWAHKDLGTSNDSFTASSVPSHGVVMLKVTTTP